MSRSRLPLPIDAFALASAGVLVAGTAAAEAPKPLEPWEETPAERRSGFVVGLSGGFGVAGLAGFPNDARKIGYESFYHSTGPRPAGWGVLWFGGALSDWFTFGIGLGGGGLYFTDREERAQSGGILFHVEGFPLYPLGGKYRDIGVFFDGGTGSVLLMPKDTEKKLVDSGAASLVSVGAFWEGVRTWRLGQGPFAMFNYMWSPSARRPAFIVGWRGVLYTGIFAKK